MKINNFFKKLNNVKITQIKFLLVVIDIISFLYLIRFIEVTEDNLHIIYYIFTFLLVILILFIILYKTRLFIYNNESLIVHIFIILQLLLSCFFYNLNKTTGKKRIVKTVIIEKSIFTTSKSPNVHTYSMLLRDSLFSEIIVKENFFTKIKKADTVILIIRDGILGYPVLLGFSKQNDTIIETSPYVQ